MRITMVKKEMADGSPCKKCREVQERLDKADQMKFIDKVVVAQENTPDSEGSLLATYHNIDKAPFFIVEEEGEETRIFTIYFKLVKEVFSQLPA